jgi:hypothetical protein
VSRRRYPRIGSTKFRPKWAEQPKGAPKCCVCGAPATHRVCVEFDIFRGDDEVVNACGDHSKDADALAQAWVKAHTPPARATEGETT